LRIIFIFLMTVCVSAMLFYALGNPFDAILTYKAAEKMNTEAYSGRMKISGVTYTMDTGLYVAQLDDGNGVVSEYIYDPAENTFTDKYREDQISVVRHTVRGDIIKRINAGGVYPEEVTVVFECRAGIIGESSVCKLDCVYIILENTEKEAFIDNVINVLKGLSESEFQSYIIMSDLYSVNFTKGNISNNRADIAARIKMTES